MDEHCSKCEHCAGLHHEIHHLKRAMETRGVIDQAKGIIMGEKRCSADDAFKVLKRLSNHTNVRLYDVALALVYRAHKPPSAMG